MRTLTFLPPTGGMNTDASPAALKSDAAVVVRNLLPGRGDSAPVRGGAAGGGMLTVNTPATKRQVGAWTYQDNWLVQRTPSSAGVYTSDGDTVVPSGTPTLDDIYAEMEGYTVGCCGSQMLFAWTPVSGGTDTVVPVTGGPFGAVSVASHLTRLFALGGSVPGTSSPALNNRLYWTDPNPDLRLGLLSLWQDDLSGLTNQIVLPAADTYVGMVAVNRVLYILGRRAIYALYGDRSSEFTVRKVIDTGAVARDAASPLASGGGFFYFSNDGLVKYEDGQVTLLSASLRPQIQRTQSGFAPVGQIEALGEGYFSVLVPDRTFSGACDWYLFHEPTRSWAELALYNVTAGRQPHLVRRLQSKTMAFGGGSPAFAVDISYLHRPEHPFAPGQDQGTTPGPIQAYAISGTQRLGMPDNVSPMRKMWAEAWSATAPGLWSAKLLDADQAALGPSIQVPHDAAGKGAGQIAGVDNFMELTQVAVRWDYAGTAAAIRGAWAGPVWLDFDVAQRR